MQSFWKKSFFSWRHIQELVLIAATASFEGFPLTLKIRIHISLTKIMENHWKIQSHLLDEYLVIMAIMAKKHRKLNYKHVAYVEYLFLIDLHWPTTKGKSQVCSQNLYNLIFPSDLHS